MPFVQLVVDDSPNAGVSGLSVALKKGKRDNATRMIIYLTDKVSDELAWPVGAQLEVMIGTEADHGMVRLRAGYNRPGAAVVKSLGKGKFRHIEISLGHVRGFVDRNEPKVPCNYESIDGWVEIVLPAWAEETHPTKPKVALPPEIKRPLVEVRRPKLGQRMTVVPNMGDPPLSRSALVAGASERIREQERLRQAEHEARTQSEAASRAGLLPIDGKGKATKLPAAMIRILARLLDGEIHDLEDLHKAMESNSANMQIVRTTVSLSKSSLGAREIKLISIRGVGYQLDPESMAAAKKAVNEAGVAAQEVAA